MIFISICLVIWTGAITSKLSTQQNDGGRVTVWTAKALKARLLLTRASVTKDAKMYEQAYNFGQRRDRQMVL